MNKSDFIKDVEKRFDVVLIDDNGTLTKLGCLFLIKLSMNFASAYIDFLRRYILDE